MIEIIPCGTEVVTKVGNFEGAITSVIINFNEVVYEVLYCNNGDFKTYRFMEQEFTCKSDVVKQKIGFRK